MSSPAASATLIAHFRALHRPGDPLLIPNPWDAGSAKILASLGFKALATTSAGSANTKGRLDGGMTLDDALVHAAEIVAATDIPVGSHLSNAAHAALVRAGKELLAGTSMDFLADSADGGGARAAFTA